MSKTVGIFNPTLGSDPEVFVFNTMSEMVYPVLDLLGGSKDAPRPLAVDGFFVQEDNVLAEFNIPPSPTKESFIKNMTMGLELLKAALPDGFIPAIRSSHSFDPQLLTDPRAIEFGCDPDFNAWLSPTEDDKEADKNPKPDTSSEPTLRSAGGHVILGYDNPDKDLNKRIIQYMDAYLGIPSVILDRDLKRRQLYGKAGAYRHKPFGVEYRTLSSFWIQEPKLIGWVYDQVMNVIEKINKGEGEDMLEHDAYIINTINTGNLANAQKFVEYYKIPMPA